MLLPQEQTSEKICEQIVDVHVPHVVGEVLEVPKTASRDRTLQETVERVVDVPVPEMVKQLVNLPKTVSENRIQERTVEHIAADTPVPQVVEEQVDVSKVFTGQGSTGVLEEDRISRWCGRFLCLHRREGFELFHAEEDPQREGSRRWRLDRYEQVLALQVETSVWGDSVFFAVGECNYGCIGSPSYPGDEQTPETLAVSFAADIFEVPVIQTQETTQQVVNTHVQHVVDTVEAEMPKIIKEMINQITKRVDVPVVLVAQVPRVPVEIPQSLFVEKTVMIPEIQTVQGPRTSESLSGEITVAGKIDHETVVRGSHHDCGRPFHVDSTSGSMHQQHTPGQAEEEREREEKDGRRRTK